MKIYATGTTGTIGKHLQNRVKQLEVDLAARDFELPAEVYESGNCVLHLAGLVGPQLVEEDLEYSHQVNVVSTERLGRQFLQSSSNRLVYVSTSHVYKPSLSTIKESDPISPQNTYARQKREAEIVLSELFSQEPERLCIARVFSVLDWDVASFTLGGGIAKLCDESSSYILNNCDDVRDFLTPKTIAGALLEISKSSDLSGVINVCSSQGLTVGEAARTMLAGSKVEVPEGRMKAGSSSNPFVVGDNSKLRAALPNLDLSWVPSTRT
ncbi:MAG: NAD(P)-dependent oxidoreductase [Actinobacteria bacterium]|nr:NAD(P)-dependent oxidoreductase [Actinomycetota bacterium]